MKDNEKIVLFLLNRYGLINSGILRSSTGFSFSYSNRLLRKMVDNGYLVRKSIKSKRCKYIYIRGEK